MQKRMEVIMLDNMQRKGANCNVTNHKLCPKFHFMECWESNGSVVIPLGLTCQLLMRAMAPFSCWDFGMVKPTPVSAPAVSSGFCVTLGLDLISERGWKQFSCHNSHHTDCTVPQYWTRTSWPVSTGFAGASSP